MTTKVTVSSNVLKAAMDFVNPKDNGPSAMANVLVEFDEDRTYIVSADDSVEYAFLHWVPRKQPGEVKKILIPPEIIEEVLPYYNHSSRSFPVTIDGAKMSISNPYKEWSFTQPVSSSEYIDWKNKFMWSSQSYIKSPFHSDNMVKAHRGLCVSSGRPLKSSSHVRIEDSDSPVLKAMKAMISHPEAPNTRILISRMNPENNKKMDQIMLLYGDIRDCILLMGENCVEGGKYKLCWDQKQRRLYVCEFWNNSFYIIEQTDKFLINTEKYNFKLYPDGRLMVAPYGDTITPEINNELKKIRLAFEDIVNNILKPKCPEYFS